MKNPISIIKASGEKSIFSEEKVRSSLRLSGADEKQIDFTNTKPENIKQFSFNKT
mgnify:CR=1 FL=1